VNEEVEPRSSKIGIWPNYQNDSGTNRPLPLFRLILWFPHKKQNEELCEILTGQELRVLETPGISFSL